MLRAGGVEYGAWRSHDGVGEGLISGKSYVEGRSGTALDIHMGGEWTSRRAGDDTRRDTRWQPNGGGVRPLGFPHINA